MNAHQHMSCSSIGVKGGNARSSDRNALCEEGRHTDHATASSPARINPRDDPGLRTYFSPGLQFLLASVPKIARLSSTGTDARRFGCSVLVASAAWKPGPDRLSLVFESPGSSTLDLPDNVVVSNTVLSCCARTAAATATATTTSCAASPVTGRCSTSHEMPTRLCSARSSPMRRSVTTVPRCTSTSNRRLPAT